MPSLSYMEFQRGDTDLAEELFLFHSLTERYIEENSILAKVVVCSSHLTPTLSGDRREYLSGTLYHWVEVSYLISFVYTLRFL
jgi:hypothetical protein